MFQFLIPEPEISIEAARSGGPGGQNVNKTETKIVLRWNIFESGVFTDAQKQSIREHLATRINKNDEIIIHAQSERSQYQNRVDAIERLHELVNKALVPVKKRIATKPTKAAKRARLVGKRVRKLKKDLRKDVENFGE